MGVRWFVSYDVDGPVSHIVRITETKTELRGEYVRDGQWHEDGSVLEYLVDQSLGSEVTAQEGEALAAEHGAPVLESVSNAGLANGFRDYFEFAGLELPDPIPAVGLVEQGDWTVRFRLADENRRLDFLAIPRSMAPLHGEILEDGTVHLFDSYLDHSVFNPAIDRDEHAAEERMNAHNQRVTDELTRKGLL